MTSIMTSDLLLKPSDAGRFHTVSGVWVIILGCWMSVQCPSDPQCTCLDVCDYKQWRGLVLICKSVKHVTLYLLIISHYLAFSCSVWRQRAYLLCRRPGWSVANLFTDIISWSNILIFAFKRLFNRLLETLEQSSERCWRFLVILFVAERPDQWLWL